MRIHALGPLAALALWGCGEVQTPIQSNISVKVVGSAGGTVIGQGGVGAASLSIPFGALAQDTPIALGDDPAPPANPPGWVPAGPSVLCSPEGLAFTRPATLRVPFSGLGNVQLFTAPGAAGQPWQAFDGGSADNSLEVVRASIAHFSRYRVYRAYFDGGAGSDAGP